MMIYSLLFIKLPKSNESIKSFKKLKYMSFMVSEKHENTLNEYSNVL